MSDLADLLETMQARETRDAIRAEVIRELKKIDRLPVTLTALLIADTEATLAFEKLVLRSGPRPGASTGG